jgi:hypothetical protein
MIPPHRGNEATAGSAPPNQAASLSLQQPYFQATGNGPALPPGGIPYTTWTETRSPGMIGANQILGTDRVVGGDVSDAVREQITRTLRELGFSPKGRARVYQKPYLEYFYMIPYPRGFRVPDFMKFTGDDARITYEHVGQFLTQVSDAGITDVHKVKLFPISLSGTTFNWFTSLAPNSVNTWAGLEERFLEYFYNGETEIKLSDLTTVRQK